MDVVASFKSFFSRLRSTPYAWVVVIILFAVLMAIIGIRASFGIFFRSIEDEFELTRAATSAIFAAFMMLGGVFAIPGGRLADKYGPKVSILIMGITSGIGLILVSLAQNFLQILLIYGILLSLGSGLIIPVMASTISTIFDKNRTLALGIVQAGGAMGGVVAPLFVTYLIAVGNWRFAYVVYGLVSGGVIVLFGLFLRPSGAKNKNSDPASGDIAVEAGPISKKSFTLTELVRNANFWKLFISRIFYNSFLFFFITHIVPYLTDLGISKGKAALMISLINGSAVAGRLVSGVAADRLNKKAILVFCILMATIAMTWMVWAGSLIEFYLIALIGGFSLGGFPPVTLSLTVDVFGKYGLGSLFGIMEIGTSIGAAFGPVLGGMLFDITNSYTAAFICSASLTLIAAILTGSVKQNPEKG
jgi:MFS family permease